jgi:hypothetical protein
MYRCGRLQDYTRYGGPSSSAREMSCGVSLLPTRFCVGVVRFLHHTGVVLLSGADWTRTVSLSESGVARGHSQ